MNLDNVVHPRHYNRHPSGLECFDVVERLSFCLGSAVKHLWRAGLAPGITLTTDVRMAAFYMDRALRDTTYESWYRGKDPILKRYMERLHEYGGWQEPPIRHILMGSLSASIRDMRTARCMLDNVLDHPQEKRDGPQARL